MRVLGKQITTGLKTSPNQQAKPPGKRGFWAHTPNVEKGSIKCLAELQ